MTECQNGEGDDVFRFKCWYTFQFSTLMKLLTTFNLMLFSYFNIITWLLLFVQIGGQAYDKFIAGQVKWSIQGVTIQVYIN